MTFRNLRLLALAGTALAALGPRGLAADTYYLVVKDGNYLQTSAGTVAYASATPFQFGVICSFAGSFVSPNDATATTLSYSSTDQAYEASESFASQAALDAAFPAGTYTVTTSSEYVNLPMPADEFPAIPSVTNGTWSSSGQLEIDPTKAFTFDFSSFEAYNTVGVASEVLFYVVDAGGQDVLDVYWTTPTNATAPTSYAISSGVLVAGATYTAHLDYSFFTTQGTTSITDSEGEVEFGSYTVFTIIAQAPDTNVLTVATQPQSQTVASGGTAVLTFGVTATPAATYQWYFNGSPLLGATAASLVLANTTAANAGAYSCVATNSAGTVTSSLATLTVSTTSDIGHLIDISCRAQVGTGGNILITGFALGGAGTSGPEPLLIRASGPALAAYSVTGFLPDPELELYRGGASAVELDSNDSWNGNPAIAAAASSVGAFPWTSTSSHDSALLETTLVAGPYTAQVLGSSGDTGIALAEIYDDPAGGVFSRSKPRLVNISARVQVGTGANILIAGFVIGGSTSETVLIRATGPTLAGYGVTGVLADPQLQLKDIGGNVLASDTIWGGNANIIAAADKVGAFAWPSASADSAILITLPPGAYTAQVSGASGDTGVALVEVYEVP